MKRIADIKKFKFTLPYSSEIFGLYQPLLGWKSKRINSRVHKGFLSDKVKYLQTLFQKYQGEFKLKLDNEAQVEAIDTIDIGKPAGGNRTVEAAIIQEISKKLPKEKNVNDEVWGSVINQESLTSLLNRNVKKNLEAWMQRGEFPTRVAAEASAMRVAKTEILKQKVGQESAIAGVLLELTNAKQYAFLKEVFYKPEFDIKSLLAFASYQDPFDYIDPQKDLDRVGVSPVGIVHLFRQYFFEFDTFLGTPVGHIWLSPGSTVELIEVSTRKTITEKALELQSEKIVKTESSLTQQDELSDAVKEDNKNDIKFGASVTANQSWVWGSASQTASFDMNTTQQTAREQSHRHMRQQSDKLATEIRTNYKSTFKTVTEYTDTTSKRYVLTNNTEELVNYELRRKMRQVGVQVQDIGSYLCWQCYVDEPGDSLGVANMVHVAKSPDLEKIPHPKAIVPLKPFTEKVNISIPFVGKDTDDKDISYTNGRETEVGLFDCEEHIEYKFPQKVTCKEVNYYLDSVTLNPRGSEVQPSVRNFTVNKNSNSASFTVQLDYVHFHGQNSVNLEASLYWVPNQDEDAIREENEKKLAEYTAEVESAYKKEFIEAAQERIKAASNIEQRKFEDLREEERIVIYRHLIQDLLTPEKKVPQSDYRTRHVVSELINSIFDVDKMLYFVAPEWWKPRMHYGQVFGTVKPSGKVNSDGTPEMVPDLTNTITQDSVVGWGGIAELREDNYYITADSTPAKLGSSLGWLLQLDGDNLRNAFLNAPWVKAVIPIRPGKEKAALNWLKQIEGTNGIGPNDMYTGKEQELQGKTMLEALDILAAKVKAKHEDSIKTKNFPDPDHPQNDDNAVTATPVDKVYEHGFYPLQGGFKVQVGQEFEVFDQWVEILPTDQVVAVEVNYDPKTGMQL